MKKISALLIASVLLLSACSSSDNMPLETGEDNPAKKEMEITQTSLPEVAKSPVPSNTADMQLPVPPVKESSKPDETENADMLLDIFLISCIR